MRSVRRLLVSGGMLAVVACGGYRTVALEATPRPTFAPQQQVRITLKSERFIDLRGVSIEGDSLVGMNGEPPARWATALADIKQVETWDAKDKRTAAQMSGAALLIGGAVTLALLIIFGLSHTDY